MQYRQLLQVLANSDLPKWSGNTHHHFNSLGSCLAGICLIRQRVMSNAHSHTLTSRARYE
jgi:hypothetical protein